MFGVDGNSVEYTGNESNSHRNYSNFPAFLLNRISCMIRSNTNFPVNNFSTAAATLFANSQKYLFIYFILRSSLLISQAESAIAQLGARFRSVCPVVNVERFDRYKEKKTNN